MKIAITGSSGYIGSVLLPLLLSEGYSLRLLTRRQNPDRKDSDSPPQHPGKVEFVDGDLLDEQSLQRLVNGVDAVIHLAASIVIDDRPNEQSFEINTRGTQSLLAAARHAGVKRFIHLSSVTAYNQTPCDERMDESRPPVPTVKHGYAYSKALSQATALGYNGNGLEVLVLAPTAILGPYDQKPSLLGKLIIKIYNGKIPALFPGGVDFVDVRDVAGAIVRALTAGTPGKAYLLSGEWVSLVALSKQIGLLKGKKISLPIIPLWLVFSTLPIVQWLARTSGRPPFYTRQSVYNLIYSNKKIDHSLAERELLFQPRPITETIRDTIEWFKQSGTLK